MKYGDWYRIRRRSDNGGCPLIRVESVSPDGTVLVTDWIDFQTQWIRPPLDNGVQSPAVRTFVHSSENDEVREKRLQHWKKVTCPKNVGGTASLPTPTPNERTIFWSAPA